MRSERTLFRLALSLWLALAITAEDKKRRRIEEELKAKKDISGKDIIIIEIEV